MGRIPNKYYEELAYIQSTGTQYIDTGFKTLNNMGVSIDFQCINQTDEQQAIFGARTSVTNQSFSLFTGTSSNRLQANYGGQNNLAYSTTSISDLNLNNRNVIEMINGSLIINNNIIKTVADYPRAQTSRNIFIFANNNQGNVQLRSRIKLYNLKLYNENNEIIADFVPCRIRETGVIGLLDLVNYDFYTNSGTGTFGYGLLVESEVSPLNSGTVSGAGTYLPGNNVTLTATANSGYEFEKWELNDYYLLTAIESTGTQYINPGITIGNDIKVIADFKYTEISTSRLFGATNGTLYYQFGINDQNFVGQPNNNGNFQNILADTNRHTVILDAISGLFQLDDTQYTLQTSTNSNSRPLSIFARNNQGTPDNYAKAILYSLKIYKNNVLVRNFIPVIQKGSIEFGLLDLVEMKFYKNSGTGSFRAYEPYPSTDVVVTDNPLSLPNLQNSFELTAYFKSIANCRYKVNGTWKNGTMYIKENGTWKTGTPKIKVNGAWKEGG